MTILSSNEIAGLALDLDDWETMYMDLLKDYEESQDLVEYLETYIEKLCAENEELREIVYRYKGLED